MKSKKQKKRKGTLRGVLCSLVMMTGFLVTGMESCAYTSDNVPGVEFSMDGGAWTVREQLPEDTDPTREASYWAESGEIRNTGIPLHTVEAGVGQHLYGSPRSGMVPIYQWVCTWRGAQCIHGKDYFNNNDEFHGYPINDEICKETYWSGWLPVCADCGEYVGALHYMNPDTVQSIQYIDMDKDYYYLCPHCDHLEQGAEYGHKCLKVSDNQYMVRYEKNAEGVDVMTSSFHMYNNSTKFEGEQVEPNKYLSKNIYNLTGYVFLYWTTNPDGTGERYYDGQEIFNLTTENYNEKTSKFTGEGIVTLYAQWKKCESTLIIDADGGVYEDTRGEVEGDITTFADIPYGTVMTLEADKLTGPYGYKVSFDTHGGTACSPIQLRKSFETWQVVGTLNGKYRSGAYNFVGPDGSTDTIKAVYQETAIELPTSTKDGKEIVGWYEDSEYKEYVGMPGDLYTPDAPITLHAKWEGSLVLKSVIDLAVPDNTYKGGVDLIWKATTVTDRFFKVFQKKAEEDYDDYKLVTSTGDVSESLSVNKEFAFTGSVGTYTIPYNGYYTFTGYGAQGSNCGEFSGGLGGEVTVKMYFDAGDIIYYTIGGQNGYGGGGQGTEPCGTGGGRTYVSYKKASDGSTGIILVAGGGGAASTTGDGGEGGAAVNLVESGGNGEDGYAGGGGGYLGGLAATGEGETEVIVDFPFISGVKEFEVPVSTSYKLEVWGASGGYDKEGAGEGVTILGSAGGYSSGTVELVAGDKLYVCVGGKGYDCEFANSSYMDGGYNGGSSGVKVGTYWDGGGGGGATHIAKNINLGVLSGYVNNKSAVLLVAGGGAGLLTNSTLYQNGCPTTVSGLELSQGGGLEGGMTKYYQRCGRGSWEHSYYGTSCSFPTGWKYFNSGVGQVSAYTGGDTDKDFGKATAPCSGGGWYGATSYNAYIGGYGGSGYVGGVEEGNTQAGVNTGNGKARITYIEPSFGTSYGGSSYANPDSLYSAKQAGVRSGDGLLTIVSSEVGFMLSQKLDNVNAPDKANPDAVEADAITIEPDGTNIYKVSWEKPDDNGTTYNHIVKSYVASTGSFELESNEVEDEITQGVTKYYLLYNTTPTMTLSASTPGVTTLNSTLQSVSKRINAPEDDVAYLHIAPVDRAGNVGPTTSVLIEKASLNPDANWSVLTEQIYISSVVKGKDYKSVYVNGSGVTFVKADGVTPFNLSFVSKVDGYATDRYQVDNLIFEVTGDGRNQKLTTLAPHTDAEIVGAVQVPTSELRRSAEGEMLLKDAMNSSVRRENKAVDTIFAQAFSISSSLNGKHLSVVPHVGASYTGDDGWTDITYSDFMLDELNGVDIVADGEAPLIAGMDVFDTMTEYDRDAGITVEFTASDLLSGLKDFKIEVFNMDNYANRVYTADASGKITININSSQILFYGDISVKATAVDNVGNEVVIEKGSSNLQLVTGVRKAIADGLSTYAVGEGAILDITTTGYADKVRIIWPAGFTNVPVEFDYTSYPEFAKIEAVPFVVPPGSDEYTITVQAIKDGRQISKDITIYVYGVKRGYVRIR